MPYTLPNLLTLIRIALIPVLILAFYWLPEPWAGPACSLIFALAGVTDALDGYLARRMGQSSPFGAFLDPVADKLMVAVALILLVEADPRPLITLSAAIIIGREITVSALREWMAELGVRGAVAVSALGKFKTIAQMVAIGVMLFRVDIWPWPVAGIGVYETGVGLLLAAAVLTLWSMASYLRAAWPRLNSAS